MIKNKEKKIEKSDVRNKIEKLKDKRYRRAFIK